MKRPLAIDLFGCCGGMVMAMLKAGFAVAATVDEDPRWADVIRMNFVGPDRLFPDCGEVPPLTADLLGFPPQQVAAATSNRLDDFRWVHGSPPCQDHSFAGWRKRSGAGHECLLAMAEWARSCRNAYVTVENVFGVEDSPQWSQLISSLQWERDTWEYSVVATWYGDPQHRDRRWIVSAPPGSRCPPVPEPTVALDAPRTWEWAMQNPSPIERVDDYRFRPASPWQSRLLPSIPPGCQAHQVTDPDQRAWLFQMYTDSIRNFIRRIHPQRPVPALLTGTNICRFLLHVHPYQHRPSTLRECARFQSFPDGYILPASLSLASRLLGEAVPLGMGSAFARTIWEAINP